MNRKALIAAAGFVCIALGESPSRRNILRRIAQVNGGKAFRASEVAEFLAQPDLPWRTTARNHLGTIPEPSPESPHEPAPESPQDTFSVLKMSDSEPPREPVPEPPREPACDVDGNRFARARGDILSLDQDQVGRRDRETTEELAQAKAFANRAATSSSPQLALLDSKTKTKSRPQSSPRNLTSEQLEGFKIRDKIGLRVRGVLHGMTLSGWRKRNGRAALDLAQSGETAESVCAFWDAELDRTGEPLVVLSWLQERMATRSAKESRSDMPGRDDDPVDPRLERIWALRDAGLPIDTPEPKTAMQIQLDETYAQHEREFERRMLELQKTGGSGSGLGDDLASYLEAKR